MVRWRILMGTAMAALTVAALGAIASPAAAAPTGSGDGVVPTAVNQTAARARRYAAMSFFPAYSAHPIGVL